MTKPTEDALWPRASHWLKSGNSAVDTQAIEAHDLRCDLAVYGVRAHRTSISATGANHTPDAIRAALARYSTWAWSSETNIGGLVARDFGDSLFPDSPEGEQVTAELAGRATTASRLAVALGGDNSVTFAAMMGAFGGDLSNAGLITFDAHHDLRDGVSNGSPVRRLVEAGLPGRNIVQIGIADFSNSPEYAARAKELGIHVIPRSHLRSENPAEIWRQALAHLGDVNGIHVDFDVDVCDRAAVPACPAAAPGGLSADQLREFAELAGRTPGVKSMDITEIDATADTPDQRTIRLGALLILEAAAGLARR
jgi:arginase family enzyme